MFSWLLFVPEPPDGVAFSQVLAFKYGGMWDMMKKDTPCSTVFNDKNGTVLFKRVPRAEGAQNTKLGGFVLDLIQCTDATDDSVIVR